MVFVGAVPVVLPLLWPGAAAAFTAPPTGFRSQVDKLDGYSFNYPEDWLKVTVSGNDILLRNPTTTDENLFVQMTSPSSSRYQTVTDLGTPEAAADSILNRYLTREFMSTRLGIKREGEVVSALERTADDGKKYYEIAIRMRSYASRNPYTASNAEVMSAYGLEWDRTLVTVLGAANQRLYELRLQTPTKLYEGRKSALGAIMGSFRCREVEV